MTQELLPPDAQLRAALAAAEQALRESQRQYREIFELASIGIFRSTPNGRIVLANPALAAMLGYDSADELRSLDLARDVYVHGEERRALVARYEHSEHPWTVEVQWKKKDGTPLWVQISAHVVPDGRSGTACFEAFVQDITERRESEEALRASEERLRLVSRATSDAVWDWDLVTDALWWGDGVQTLFGYPPEAIEPGIESWHNRLHPDDRDRVIAEIGRAIDGGHTFWSDEYRFRRRDGTYADIYDRGYVIHDADGRPVRMVGSMLDVTERQRVEAQLRNLAARLEAIREEERTRIAREIHDQLGQALTALKMDLAWLAKKLPARPAALRPKLRDMERVIDATMDAMHRIVAELRPGVLDDLGLPAAIRWLAADFQERTHIRCAVSVTGAEPSLETAQATAVFRILQEALTNVARHARARHVDIRFHVVPTALELVVADDGRGITADEVQNRRTLGLLGIRERALTWHGQVTIHGAPARGTTVRVFMPIVPATPAGTAA